MANWGEQTRLVFRLAVGLYLIYLAYQVISAQLGGGTDMPGLVAYGGGGVLGLAGLAFCGYSFVRYRRQCRANREEDARPADGEEP